MQQNANNTNNWMSASKSKCSIAPAPPVCATETNALLQDEAIHFHISRCSYPDL